MTQDTATFVLGCLLAGGVWPAGGGPVLASELRPVTLTLQAVTLTTDSWQAVTFLVTNAGSRPVDVVSCGCSGIPTNVNLPLGCFGHCTVPPRTNCTMSFKCRNYRSGPHWWRYAVFTPATTIRKAEVAAERLQARVSGKAHYTEFWLSDAWSPAYEITSPIVAELPKLPPLPDEWPRPHFWRPAPEPSAARPPEAEQPAPWSPGFDWLTDANSGGASSLAQPDGPANGSQPMLPETNQTSAAAGSRR
jgi:hypothetical protein